MTPFPQAKYSMILAAAQIESGESIATNTEAVAVRIAAQSDSDGWIATDGKTRPVAAGVIIDIKQHN